MLLQDLANKFKDLCSSVSQRLFQFQSDVRDEVDTESRGEKLFQFSLGDLEHRKLSRSLHITIDVKSFSASLSFTAPLLLHHHECKIWRVVFLSISNSVVSHIWTREGKKSMLKRNQILKLLSTHKNKDNKSSEPCKHRSLSSSSSSLS